MKDDENKKTTRNNNSKNNDGKNVGRLAAWGTLWTCMIRLLNFGLNQIVLVRVLDLKSIGKMSIGLELLLSSCMLFGGRDGFRLAMSSSSMYSRSMSYFVIPMGWTASLLCAAYHFFHSTNTNTNSEEDLGYKWAGLLYCGSAMMEYACEPYYLYARVQFQVSTLAKAEGMAILLRVASMILLLTLLSLSPLLACGLSQLLYSTVLCYIYVTTIQIPTPTSHNTLNSNVSWYTIANCMLQCLFQYVLTQGDRIVLNHYASSSSTIEQAMGIYAIITNYGGFISRFLFQPLEEQSRLLFAAHQHQQQQQLQITYTIILKLVIYIGMLFASIATNYTSIVLHLLLPKTKTSDHQRFILMDSALSTFCIYILILATNGITEAFVYAILPSSLNHNNNNNNNNNNNSNKHSTQKLLLYHAFVAILFYTQLAPPLLQHHHAVGLIIANGIAMTLRIIYSFFFASQYFANTTTNTATTNSRPNTSLINRQQTTKSSDWYTIFQTFQTLLYQCLPHPIILGIFLISYFTTHQSNQSYQQQQQALLLHNNPISHGALRRMFLVNTIPHISIGIACVIIILLAFYKLERQFQYQLKLLLTSRTTTTDKQKTN